MAALTLKQALAQFWLQITNKFVSRESGKGLSTNDYSDADKQKLNSIPATVGTITGVTAGNGLSGGGTSGAITLAAQVDRGLSIVSDKIGHSNSITSGTASEGGSTRTLTFGGTFNVPSVTYDARGHISGKGSVTLTMPAKPTASDVGAVPTSRTVNGKALSSNITLAASDVGAIAAADKGAANGVASLGSDGRVPSSQLPSYVDDVLEYTNKSSFPATGETGKIYVSQNDNKTYRWSGSAYVEISPSLALGTTSSTAFAGDKGNAAYAHAVTNKGIAKASGLYKITTNSEGHVTDATAVVKADITGLGIPSGDTGATSVGTSGSGNAITGASYDSATRKITLQKDSTFALQSDLNTVSTNASNAALTVQSTNVAPTTNTKYYPVFSDAEGNETDGVYKHANISYRVEKGDTATAGRAQLILGNASAVGTAGNSTGYITLYSNNGSDHRIYPSEYGQAGQIHTLPDKGGVLFSSGNFNSWVPAKDGTGATGTWDISISGSAYKAILDGDGNTISSTYLPLAGGALTGRTYSSSTVDVDAGASFRNINIVGPTTTIEAGVTAIPTGEIWIKYE